MDGQFGHQALTLAGKVRGLGRLAVFWWGAKGVYQTTQVVRLSACNGARGLSKTPYSLNLGAQATEGAIGQITPGKPRLYPVEPLVPVGKKLGERSGTGINRGNRPGSGLCIRRSGCQGGKKAAAGKTQCKGKRPQPGRKA
jgi:hypothetical protein